MGAATPVCAITSTNITLQTILAATKKLNAKKHPDLLLANQEMPVINKRNALRICASSDLAEKAYLLSDITYNDEAHSAIIFRFKGQVYAYLNLCVHMPRQLNCERDTVFDDKKEMLRCSMHGIVYDPFTGESQSTMCHGEKLFALKVTETQGEIYFVDKKVKSLESGCEPSNEPL